MTARARITRTLIALSLVPALALVGCTSDDAAPSTSTTSSSVVAPSSTPVETSASSVESVPTTTETPVPTETLPPPGPTVDPLTGGEVSPNILVAVKIDNTFPGKQWGVADADVVYVEMVEGNLSRLIALFHTVLPEEVGPVRSVRTTDPDVLTAYGKAALMFSGGAGGPLDNFASSGLVDASPPVFGDAYWRSSAASAPYDLHGNVQQVADGVGPIGTPGTPGFVFGDDYPALAGQRDVGSISAAFANPISFEYANGVYNFIRRGSVQTDGATGATFEFQNVLVQKTTAEPDGNVDVVGSPSYKTATIGSGAFTLYRDGKAIDGTWNRLDGVSPTSYRDAAGVPVQFRTGKTWVVLAPDQISTSEG